MTVRHLIYGSGSKFTKTAMVKKCPGKKIERHYIKYGKWRGLAMWCDMMEKWISRIVRL
jgi:hypothetical protein